MTRKKAIEAAVDRTYAEWRDTDYGECHGGLYWTSAEHAYDLGRIAGLREAAQLNNSARTWHAKLDVTRIMREKIASLSRRLKL